MLTTDQRETLAQIVTMQLMACRASVDTAHEDVLDLQDQASPFEVKQWEQASKYISLAVESLGRTIRYARESKTIEQQREVVVRQLESSLKLVSK